MNEIYFRSFFSHRFFYTFRQQKQRTWKEKLFLEFPQTFLKSVFFARLSFFRRSCFRAQRKSEVNTRERKKWSTWKVTDGPLREDKRKLSSWVGANEILEIGKFELRWKLLYKFEVLIKSKQQQQAPQSSAEVERECVISCGCAFILYTITHNLTSLTPHINCACRIDNLLRAKRTFARFLVELQQFYFASHRVHIHFQLHSAIKIRILWENSF